MDTFSLVMWAEPKVDIFECTIQKVYKILESLKEYGEELSPNYQAESRKCDAIAFSLEEKTIRELLQKKTNREGNIEFPDLGFSISFFSSMKADESCGIRMKVGVSNPRFKNTLVIHFPSMFSGYEQRAMEFKELFKKLIIIFEPYWACVSNDKNVEMYKGEYWISDKPSTIHWLNYFGGDTVQKLNIDKLKNENDIFIEEFLDGYILYFQDEPIDVCNESHVIRQREINKYLSI